MGLRSTGHESLDVKMGTGPHEKQQIQNPEITQVIREGAASGGTAGCRRDRQDRTPTKGRPEERRPSYPSNDWKMPPDAYLCKQEPHKAYINQRRNKTLG